MDQEPFLFIWTEPLEGCPHTVSYGCVDKILTFSLPNSPPLPEKTGVWNMGHEFQVYWSQCERVRKGMGLILVGQSQEMLCIQEPSCVATIEFLPNSFFQQVFIKWHYLFLWTALFFWAPGTMVNKMCWQKLETQRGVGTERFCYWTTEQLDHLRKKILFYTEMLKDFQCVVLHNSATLELQIWGLGRYCPRWQ